MARCDGCGLWFHRLCESIPDVIFQKASSIWYCTSCAKAKEKVL